MLKTIESTSFLGNSRSFYSFCGILFII